MAPKNRNRCTSILLRACFVGSALLNIVPPPANAAQDNDVLVGVYGADLQGRCNIQPFVKIAKEAGSLAGYVWGDDDRWHEVELVLPTEDQLKEVFKDGGDPRGVSVIGVSGVGDIYHAPKGWRYNASFKTETGDFAGLPYNALVDLQKTEGEVGPDYAQKQNFLCLQNRHREEQ